MTARRRWALGVSAAAVLALVALLLVPSAGSAPTDTAQTQLDRIDANAYGACLNAAGSSVARQARCTAPPSAVPSTSRAPATTTSPPPSPPGECAWPACFPTAATTGVPAGATLTAVGSDLHAPGGSTVDGKDIQGSLIVDGDNVTVTRSRIHGVVFNGSHIGLTVTDSEITANPGQDYSTGNFPPITGSYTLTRVHVHRWQDGPRTDQGTATIRDSLVDELAYAAGEHPDAVQDYCPGCTVHVTLDHNTLSGCAGNAGDKGNSALFWSDHPGPNSTLLATHNQFRCGQYSIRVNDTGSGIIGNHPGVVAEVRDNTVAAGSWAQGPAECGNARAYDATRGDGVKWSGNVLSTGQAVPSPCS